MACPDCCENCCPHYDPCFHCGKPFHNPPYRARDLFCSHECQVAALEEAAARDHVCTQEPEA